MTMDFCEKAHSNQLVIFIILFCVYEDESTYISIFDVLPYCHPWEYSGTKLYE